MSKPRPRPKPKGEVVLSIQSVRYISRTMESVEN